jgi:hypothetical protein
MLALSVLLSAHARWQRSGAWAESRNRPALEAAPHLRRSLMGA